MSELFLNFTFYITNKEKQSFFFFAFPTYNLSYRKCINGIKIWRHNCLMSYSNSNSISSTEGNKRKA